MGRAATYTREHHQKAWEIWYETRNLSETCRRMNISQQTGIRWKDKGFNCAFNCPYHDYDGLAHDVAKANQARLELVNKGETDPVAIDSAMRAHLTHGGKRDDNSDMLMDAPAMDIIRKNDLVVGDFEFLYRKIYYLATGQTLTPTHAIITANGDAIDINWAGEYEKGIGKINSIDKAIESLIHLRNEIEKRTGASAAGENGVVLENITETKRVTIPLEQLAQMREQILRVQRNSAQLDAG